MSKSDILAHAEHNLIAEMNMYDWTGKDTSVREALGYLRMAMKVLEGKEAKFEMPVLKV